MKIIAEKITIHHCGKKNKLLSNEVFKNPKKVLLFIYFDHLSKRVARRIILLFNPKLIVLLVLFFLIIL